MKAGSGLVQGLRSEPLLAEQAVKLAMERAHLQRPEAVLLFLSSDFAADPRPAITAAARAASCTQVAGCTAAGVFSEEDWVLDAPAAVALVLGEGGNLGAHCRDRSPCLTFCAPNAVDLNWLSGGPARIGGVAGDASGQGPYTVWSAGREREDGRAELAMQGLHLSVGVSQGVRPISHPALLGSMHGIELLQVGGQPALVSLSHALPLSMRSPEHIPLHLLMAGVPFGDPLSAIEEGRYHLLPVLDIDARRKTVRVAGELPEGALLFWALRQPQAAERDLSLRLAQLDAQVPRPPDFALMFPCLGRGPAFYNGEERDLAAFRQQFPGVPLAGFYGNGEIAHLDGANRLLQYSVVLGLGYGDAR